MPWVDKVKYWLWTQRKLYHSPEIFSFLDKNMTLCLDFRTHLKPPPPSNTKSWQFIDRNFYGVLLSWFWFIFNLMLSVLLLFKKQEIHVLHRFVPSLVEICPVVLEKTIFKFRQRIFIISLLSPFRNERGSSFEQTY